MLTFRKAEEQDVAKLQGIFHQNHFKKGSILVFSWCKTKTCKKS